MIKIDWFIFGGTGSDLGGNFASFSLIVIIDRRWLVGVLEYAADFSPSEVSLCFVNCVWNVLVLVQVLQIFRITKSDKIDPPGHCVAVSHDVDDFECLNHASKSDILKVAIQKVKTMYYTQKCENLATEGSGGESTTTCCFAQGRM